MSTRYKKAVIDDVSARNIDKGTETNLLDLFDCAMKSIASTLVCEAKFSTTDFATAKDCDCEGFALMSSATWSSLPQSVVLGTSQSDFLASPV